MNNELPNPDVLVWHCRDFIMRSALTRKALDTSWPQFHVAVHDLVEEIQRLANSCHLPEFTDHALPHICSLVDRIERWTCADSKAIAEILTQDQAAVLLVATLFHDLGMLSQNENDMPDNASPEDTLSFIGDLPSWVRQTHVKRLPKLAHRIIKDLGHIEFENDQRFSAALCIGEAHQSWPWEWRRQLKADKSDRALAAILAISDLLDEDCARCDTKTLLHHRRGTELNMAHWVRHSLSQGRILVTLGTIAIHMVCPPNTSSHLAPVFAALRNHYRLVFLYANELSGIGVSIKKPVTFFPKTGIPLDQAEQLADWSQLDGFETETALTFQLLRTFMAEAVKDNSRLDPSDLKRLRRCKLEDVDFSILKIADSISEPRSSDERTFHALIGGL